MAWLWSSGRRENSRMCQDILRDFLVLWHGCDPLTGERSAGGVKIYWQISSCYGMAWDPLAEERTAGYIMFILRDFLLLWHGCDPLTGERSAGCVKIYWEISSCYGMAVILWQERDQQDVSRYIERLPRVLAWPAIMAWPVYCHARTNNSTCWLYRRSVRPKKIMFVSLFRPTLSKHMRPKFILWIPPW